MTAPAAPPPPHPRRRGFLLGPAISVMNRLKYPQKFLLISLLFAIPLALTMYFLLSELHNQISFTHKETLGTRYLRPLLELLRHEGEARRLAHAFSGGDRSVRPELQRKFSEIDADFAALDALDGALGKTLSSTSRLTLLKGNWAYLKKESAEPGSKAVDKLHETFLGEIRGLMSHVGDTSNLILDPDLDTYYLMDAVLLKFPETQSLLLKAGFQGELIAARRTISPEERADLIVLVGLIRSNIDASRKGVDVAFQNNPRGTSRPRLEKPYDDFVEVARASLDQYSRDLVDAPAVTVAPEAVAALVARPLAASFSLWKSVADELDDLMKARLDRLGGRRQVAWVSTLLVLVLVAYLWIAFYAAVMRTVSDLEEASRRMIQDDPGQELVLETKDELGRVTQSFNAIAQQLRREWKQAYEDNVRARAAEARLQESEERTRLILQSALDAVITIDAEGKVLEWNPRAAAIFGWPRDEAVGKKLSVLIIPEKYRAPHEEGLRRFAATGEGPILNKRFEITALRRDGGEFPVELSITPIRHGKEMTFSAFLRDITERKKGEEEIKKAKEAAETANQAKSEFLAGMSHELRTPLNSIIGFSTVILKGKGKHLKEQDAAFLERILDNGKHLLGLINSILDLSKIEAGKVELNIVPVALDTLVRETVAQLEGRLVDKKEVKLAAELPPRLAPFLTDPDKLRQILINLVGNAIKFTEKGGITVRVEADTVTHLPRKICVSDTGVGIPKEMLGRIFDAFEQVETGMARKYEGTGLGLTISRSLSTLLGYRIDVESEVGKGSTFSLHLVPVGVEPETRRATLEPAAAAVPELRDRLVLVIDDDDDSRILLRQYISDCGCRVAEAARGTDALRLARELKPDLITLDLLMPGVNGWEILGSLKSDPLLRDVPVVVVSIVGKENRGTIFGAADLLTKPVSREDLCAVLRRNCPAGNAKVLVVDDDPAARSLMADQLSQEQAEIRTAANGQEALAHLESFAPGLVILDLMMPVMDGMTFLDTIRRDPRHAALTVVVATAKELTVQETRQLEASVAVVLRKGEDFRADLTRVIQTFLRRKPADPSRKERIPVRVRAVVADLVPDFLAARRQEAQTILKALEIGDFDMIRVLGHSMKGVGSGYGFEGITQIGRRLEEAAGAADAEAVRKHVAELTDYLDRVDVVKA